TLTEIYDYLRLLFAHIGEPHCYKCGRRIRPQTIEDMTNHVMRLEEGCPILILSPLVRGRKGEYRDLLEDIQREGYLRVRVDGEIHLLEEDVFLDKNKKHTVEVVVDRLKVKKGIETIEDLLGPLGIPSPIEKIGTVICVGGGVGVAPLYPEAKRYQEVGNKVISLIGARSKNLFFFMDKMGAVSDEIRYSTDDGSFAHHGFVTDLVKQTLESGVGVDEAVVIGPLPMMKRASEITKEYNLKTRVSLNSIMVDATGMCGCCRVRVGDKVKFTCVDGPGFDGHLVDFDELMLRQKDLR
ncbi:unnamed protein product, partial [marine sediment metagenome]